MSYQNQSDSDHLSIIIGPPGPDNLIDSVHNVASAHNISLDDAWTAYVKLMADKFIKRNDIPNEYGFTDFSNMFTDVHISKHIREISKTVFVRDIVTLDEFIRHQFYICCPSIIQRDVVCRSYVMNGID